MRAGTSPYTFIEIMGCPGGCVNGGGQPYVKPAFLPNEDANILDTSGQVKYSRKMNFTSFFLLLKICQLGDEKLHMWLASYGYRMTLF